MKKLLSAMLAMSMCLSITAAVNAEAMTTNEHATQNNNLLVYSPEFPDAYIIEDVSISETRSDSISQTVSATVFVEETYGLDVNGGSITISSRLLTEDEVRVIGIENFEDIGTAKQEAITKTQQTRNATASHGKLTLTFSETHRISNNGVYCDLVSKASWSAAPGLYTNDELYPAPGYDYMGIVWSGGYTTSTVAPHSDCNLYNVKAPDLISERSEPNAGRVWKFKEAWIHDYALGSPVFAYLTDIDIKMTLRKNNMTGGGNTAEAVVKYIHTYEDVTGSISIGANTDGVFNGGFTLSTVSKQWSIACTVTGMPY